MSSRESSEFIRFIRPATIAGVELLVARNCARKWHVFHERYEVCTSREVAVDWRYRGKTHFMSDNTYALFEPGKTHVNTRVLKPASFNVLFMCPSVVTLAAEELGVAGAPHLRLAQDNNRSILRVFEGFFASIEANESTLELQSRLVTCVQVLIESYSERARSLPRIRAHLAVARAKMVLQERYAEAVSLDELSTVAGLSRFHLLRTFAEHVGLPPHAYQNHIRTERAKFLLRAGEKAAAVATSVGFADQSHLTRHFKRIWGVTPSAYARAMA